MRYFLLLTLAFVATIFLNQGCTPEQVTTLPTVSTTTPTSVTQSSCATGGNVSQDGGATVTERGICYSTTANPTTANSKVADSGTGTGTFATNITGLSTNTTYHVRAYAVNSQGVAYGGDFSFTTLTQTSSIPTVTTTTASSITENSCATGGNVTSDGGLPVLERGVCYGGTPNPTTNNSKVMSGTGVGSFSVTLSNLNYSSTYYARAYAINSSGTAYGNEITFTTDNPTVADVDGNTYQTVWIGGKLWMKTNLNVSRYRNLDAIPKLTSTPWSTATSGAHASPNDIPSNDAIFGKLYNSYAANDSRGLCPSGWHIPTKQELDDLVTFLGGNSVAGDKMKLPDLNYWTAVNTANNLSGFSALGAGKRFLDGSYQEFKSNAYFWTETDAGSGTMWSWMLSYNSSSVNISPSFNRTNGFSCRCVKD